MVQVGLSLIPNLHSLQAAAPLLFSRAVDALEWGFDMSPIIGEPDPTSSAMLDDFSAGNALYGHGVRYSVCSAGIGEHHRAWLAQLAAATQTRHYQHITEHFGLMLGEHFHHGAPMPLPLTSDLLEVARRNFGLLREAYDGPLGLENLALAFNWDEVKRQGDFIARIVEPVGGFLLLDLHNIYCQSENFACPAEEIVNTYPLQLVREIHVSGGSWAEVEVGASRTKVRCDTHNDQVPEAVFQLLAWTLQRTPNAELVIFEQLPAGLETEKQRAGYRADFERIREIAHGC